MGRNILMKTFNIDNRHITKAIWIKVIYAHCVFIPLLLGIRYILATYVFEAEMKLYDTSIQVLILTMMLTAFFYYMAKQNVETKIANNYYKSLFYNDLYSTLLIDLKGEIFECNSAVEKMFGYSKKQLLHQKLSSILTFEETEKHIDSFELALSGKPKTFETVLKHYDGRLLEVEIAFVPVFLESNILSVIATLTNIHDRKNVQYRLEEMSIMDGVTEIPNRRHFDHVLESEFQKCMKEGLSLALIMFDIDQFKNFNDTYGHLQGDTCLKDIAQQINSLAKEHIGVCARYGGEEFGLILPGKTTDQSIQIAEKMRIKVEELSIPHKHSKVSNIVTISVGIAHLNKTFSTKEQLIMAADQALYHSKNNGRNQVSVSSQLSIL